MAYDMFINAVLSSSVAEGGGRPNKNRTATLEGWLFGMHTLATTEKVTRLRVWGQEDKS